MKYSFVIPCYRSEKTIESTVDEIRETMKSKSEESYEIILVNDCSPDGVLAVLRRLAREDSKITALSLSKNFGQHSAVMAGFSRCSGEVVIVGDDDGQTPFCECFNLIDALSDDCDVCFARYGNKKHSLFRNFGSFINDKMACFLLSKPKDLFLSSYFAAKRYIIDEVTDYDKSFPYLSGLLLRATKFIKNADVNHRERALGGSGYTFGKLLGLWLNGFTAFSVKPLRIATVIGLITAVGGFGYSVFALISSIINPDTPLGWASTVSVTLIMGGLILMTLGLLGEYLGRIYLAINNAPQFVIREEIKKDK